MFYDLETVRFVLWAADPITIGDLFRIEFWTVSLEDWRVRLANLSITEAFRVYGVLLGLLGLVGGALYWAFVTARRQWRFRATRRTIRRLREEGGAHAPLIGVVADFNGYSWREGAAWNAALASVSEHVGAQLRNLIGRDAAALLPAPRRVRWPKRGFVSVEGLDDARRPNRTIKEAKALLERSGADVAVVGARIDGGVKILVVTATAAVADAFEFPLGAARVREADLRAVRDQLAEAIAVIAAEAVGEDPQETAAAWTSERRRRYVAQLLPIASRAKRRAFRAARLERIRRAVDAVLLEAVERDELPLATLEAIAAYAETRADAPSPAAEARSRFTAAMALMVHRDRAYEGAKSEAKGREALRLLQAASTLGDARVSDDAAFWAVYLDDNADAAPLTPDRRGLIAFRRAASAALRDVTDPVAAYRRAIDDGLAALPAAPPRLAAVICVDLGVVAKNLGNRLGKLEGDSARFDQALAVLRALRPERRDNDRLWRIVTAAMLRARFGRLAAQYRSARREDAQALIADIDAVADWYPAGASGFEGVAAAATGAAIKLIEHGDADGAKALREWSERRLAASISDAARSGALFDLALALGVRIEALSTQFRSIVTARMEAETLKKKMRAALTEAAALSVADDGTVPVERWYSFSVLTARWGSTTRCARALARRPSAALARAGLYLAIAARCYGRAGAEAAQRNSLETARRDVAAALAEAAAEGDAVDLLAEAERLKAVEPDWPETMAAGVASMGVDLADARADLAAMIDAQLPVVQAALAARRQDD